MTRLRIASLLLLLFTAAPALQGQVASDGGSSEPMRLLPIKVAIDAPEEGVERDLSVTVEIVLLLTFLTLIPPLLLTMTCFTRIVIVLAFVKRAMATPEAPPSQVVIGLALFLTAAIMQPVAGAIHREAIVPYMGGEMTFIAAGQAASTELKAFLIRHTRHADVELFMEMSDEAPVENLIDLPITIVIPSFILSELRTAFQMGFVLYLPFLVIDLVVASILLSMGMFMLPPMLIATPIKILLFILVDGWSLVVRQLWTTYLL